MLSSLQQKQLLIFTLGWLSYASTYFLRKPLGVVKSDMEEELNLSKVQLGLLDTALLLPYAVMQMLLGQLGDRFGSRLTYGLSLMLAAVSMMTFGWFSSMPMFFILMFINGTGQSQAWPNCTKVLGAWYPDDKRNTVFGVFGTCCFAGGIAGTALAVHLQTKYGWRQAFLTPSLFVLTMGLLILVLFKLPSDTNMEVPGKATADTGPKAAGERLGFFEMWKIPVLPEAALSMFCLKIVRYCMYMWLPMYLKQRLNYGTVQAGMFSTTFEIGGVFGSACIGLVIDRFFGGRALQGSAVFCLLSSVSLIFFSLTASWGVAVNAIFLFLAGLFNCGPDSILGGSLSAELGEMNGRNAAAAVAGMINGFGSVGTFLEGPIIGWVSDRFGFASMFWLMIVLALFGTMVTFRAATVYARLKASASYNAVPVTEEA